MTRPQNVDEYFEVLKEFAARRGLLFNPEDAIVRPLVEGLWANKQRYGYPSCPCRLAWENLEQDRDIICPCAYAEPDIQEFGQCYCGLYVHREVADGRRAPLSPVPERRPPEKIG